MEYPMNQIIHGDSYEILPTLPDKSFDTVIIDPPYKMGLDEWDKAVDIHFFTEQIHRITNGFYAVFGQMPYMREWDREAENLGFQFKAHISWVKRACSPYGSDLKRIHEDILIYAVNKQLAFYKTDGNYEDVKLPGVLFDVITIDAIHRYISDLWLHIKRGEGRIKKASYAGQSAHLKKYSKRYDGHGAKRTANFTDVWSFLPETKVNYNRGGKFHPTMKPVLLEQRLVEMLTPEQGSVLDCFSGSGTTAIACKRLNRNFLCIEKQQDFYEYSLERLRGDVYQPDLNFTEN